MMVSIMAFDKPCSGAKTLGWDTQMDLENDFKNLGISSYSIEELPKMSFENEMGMNIPEFKAGGFYKGHW
jgi:hypothetical protein